jgi:hypothetical protein
MTCEADRDIKTPLALLQVEGLGGADDGSTAERGYFANTRAYWDNLAQLRRDKASLVAEVAELEQTVKKVEKERDDARAQASKAARERDTARAEVARFEAARDKECAVKAAAAQAAWDEEVATHREKKAALSRAEKVREEVDKAREEVDKRRKEALIAAQAERSRTQTAAEKLAALRDKRLRDAQADYASGVAIVRDSADDQLEADLIAEVERDEALAQLAQLKASVANEKAVKEARERAVVETAAAANAKARRKARDEADAERQKYETDAERTERERIEAADYRNRY